MIKCAKYSQEKKCLVCCGCKYNECSNAINRNQEKDFKNISYTINKKDIVNFEKYLTNEISELNELIKEFPEGKEYVKGSIEAYSRVNENFNALRFYFMKCEEKNNNLSLFQKLIKLIRGDSYSSSNNSCG